MHDTILQMRPKPKALCTALLIALVAAPAHSAVTSTGNNFTMVQPDGVTVPNGGANDVAFTWDGTLNTAVSGAVSNAQLSSATLFFGTAWTAHDVTLYGPGTYTVYAGCSPGNAGCGTGPSYTFTVGAGEIGAHMLFDWGATTNIDVVDVWQANAVFAPSSMYTVGGGNAAQVWDHMSKDWDGDGYNGGKMIDGPFVGFSANFNVMGVADTSPTPFNGLFDDQNNVGTNAPIVSTYVLTVSGINVATPISVAGSTAGSNSQYCISTDNGANYSCYTVDGTVQNGNWVRLQHTSSASAGQPTNTVLTIGDQTDTFTSVTAGGAGDTVPETFTGFPPKTNVLISTQITSDPVQITNIDTPSPATISVGGEFDLNDNNWITSGNIPPNAFVRVRHMSAAAYNNSVTTTLTIGGIPGTFTSTTGAAPDTAPNPFSFPSQSNVAVGTEVTSASVPITGLTGAADISISAGSVYELNNSGTWLSTPQAAAVNNNDTVRVRHTSSASAGTSTTTTLTIGGINGTFTSTTAGGTRLGNFTMLDPAGVTVGGTNDVSFTWDGTTFTPSTLVYTGRGSVSNATIASSTPFFGYQWRAHTVQVLGPGIYSFDPSIGNEGTTQESGTLTLTVGPNQLGAHILFDWGASLGTSCGFANCNIDVVIVWDQDTTFQPPMYTGAPNPGSNDTSTVFRLASVDGDGDGIAGIPMPAGGPFAGFRANFSLVLATGSGGGGFQSVPYEVSESKKMPGCSLVNRPVSPLERGDWWLVAGFLAWLGIWRSRARQQSLH